MIAFPNWELTFAGKKTKKTNTYLTDTYIFLYYAKQKKQLSLFLGFIITKIGFNY